jgi:serine/threonine-protein kinase
VVAGFAGADLLKDVGDGFMAVSATASDAVRAALLLQHAISREVGEERFRTRIGIHQGEASVLDVDIHGKPKLVGPAADLTARVMSLALPGQILASRAAFNDARQYVGEHPVCAQGEACPLLRWQAHGFYRFKGVEEPQEVFEVGAEGVAPLAALPDGEKAWYVGSPDEEELRGWQPALGQAIPGRAGWVLERNIAEGGFGEVWLGWLPKANQRRVFKFCFDAERLRSFKRELTILRLLRESLGDLEDIARIEDLHMERPPYYLVSEYADEGTLADWVERRGGLAKVPMGVRIEKVARTAEAVAAAHSVGVLHKDLKPSNILVRTGPDGTPRPMIADFGIGVLTDRSRLKEHGITAAGLSVSQRTDNRSSRTGTRLYAPPEMDVGKPFTVQGDVYALGVLLYQMVTGDLLRPLGTGWEKDVEDVDLRETIAEATMRDQAARPATVTAFAERLRGLDERKAARERAAAERARREDCGRARERLALCPPGTRGWEWGCLGARRMGAWRN